MNIKLHIGKILVLPRNGKYILCCIDPVLDNLLESEIINLLSGRKIYLYIDDEFVKTLHINNVETSSSIIYKKNIY